ncbi:glycosyltransferase family 4 protein [Xenorhabdus bovienii]|uniref:WbbG n=1 Tax=Xenorhabdus bovienii str. feltiae Moldova TaxID=1398200 RepID=A0A077NQS2_XENBV|nr:glycosyltransferase family 4 protein [Xenorhabdus bovienii]CDH00889.1 WbbG [Xenorhabdus bovienii str. feltiae Moldova]
MKKVAHIQVIPKLSGVQNFSLHILSNLKNYDKYIICSDTEVVNEQQKKEFINQFENFGIKIIWLKHLKRAIGIHDILACYELWKIFKKYNFDIIHTNSTKPGIIGRIVAKLSGCKKIIHTVHGISFHKNEKFIKRILFYLLEIFSLQFGHINISVNKYYLKFYQLFFWKKTINIYNGIDFNRLNENIDITLKNKKNILFVGRLDTQKNPLGAILAFDELLKKDSDIYFDIVGDGDLRKDCEDLVHKLGIEKNVNFHGWSNTPVKFYLNSSLFFCPSLHEAFGFTFVEAAFFKLPIISSNVEGIPEVVINKKMGLLSEPYNYKQMAENIYSILNNSSLSEEMGNYGKQFVKENFQLSECIEKYSTIYDK